MSELTEEDENEIEKLRNPYESNREWQMRKDFLTANYGKFPLDKLVCLSNCYVNIEVYGSRYPLMVMGQINELSDGLNIHKTYTDAPRKVKGVQMMQFVRSSNSENTSSFSKKDSTALGQMFTKAENSQISDRHNDNHAKHEMKDNSSYVSKLKSHIADLANQCEPKPVSHTQVAVINSQKKMTPGQRADNSSKAPLAAQQKAQHTEGPTEIDMLFQSFCSKYVTYRNKFKHRTAIDVMHMVAMKAKIKLDTKFEDHSIKSEHKFCCTLFAENVQIGHGECSNKKGAKHKAFENAEEKLLKKHVKIERINPEKQLLIASDEPFVKPETDIKDQIEQAKEKLEVDCDHAQGSRKRTISDSEGDLSKFIIFEPEKLSVSHNASSVLKQSADTNKAELLYEFHDDSTGVRCRVTLDGQVLVEYMGTSRSSAKVVASGRALDRLRKICWTIKIKQDADTDGSVSRDQVMSEIQKSIETIAEDNIGNKLLRKMGWKGGGVGAEGNKGSEVPVAVLLNSQTVLRREGLGLHSNMSEFKTKIKEVIQNYAKSDNQSDLAFSSDFSKEERAYIHQLCQKLGLKSQSRGAGNERYLCVSRRRSAFQLFNHLVKEGGATAKYELIPPLVDS